MWSILPRGITWIKRINIFAAFIYSWIRNLWLYCSINYYWIYHIDESTSNNDSKLWITIWYLVLRGAIISRRIKCFGDCGSSLRIHHCDFKCHISKRLIMLNGIYKNYEVLLSNCYGREWSNIFMILTHEEWLQKAFFCNQRLDFFTTAYFWRRFNSGSHQKAEASGITQDPDSQEGRFLHFIYSFFCKETNSQRIRFLPWLSPIS